MWAKNRQSAFTIVELLIVIVVIAILAAITIVAYNGIQDRARASAAASSSSQAAKKIKVWQVDNEATSPTCAQFYSLITNGSGSSCSFDYKDTNYQYTPLTAGAFCVTTTVVNKSYKVSESTTPQAGGCQGHGQGGVAAVTNASRNPSAESNLTGYTGANGATIAQSSTQAKDGTYSTQFTMPAQATSSIVGVNVSAGYTVPTDLKANTLYTLAVWVYVPSATVNLHLSAQSAVTSTSCTNASPITTKNAWVRATCTFTTGTSGTVALYILNAAATTAGMLAYVDSVMITEGSTVYNYADGTYTNWAWNGTSNNSTSTGPPQ